MIGQVAGKVAQTLLVLFIVSIASFFFLKMAPGDPVMLLLGAEYSPQSRPGISERLGRADGPHL